MWKWIEWNKLLYDIIDEQWRPFRLHWSNTESRRPMIEKERRISLDLWRSFVRFQSVHRFCCFENRRTAIDSSRFLFYSRFTFTVQSKQFVQISFHWRSRIYFKSFGHEKQFFVGKSQVVEKKRKSAKQTSTCEDETRLDETSSELNLLWKARAK